MLKASTPPDETARLESLKQLFILDTPPEERFDRITRLLVHFYAMPIAAVSLIDADRVWLKSGIGTPFLDIPREMSFCAHVIAAGEMVIVCDTLKDERFSDNPYVTSIPHIRSYFGVPIMGPGGYPVGVLCMVDHKPRRLSAKDIDALVSLSAIAGNELAAVDITRAVAEQSRNEKGLRLVLNHLPDGVVMFDENGIVESYNPAAERLFCASRSSLLGAAASALTTDELSLFTSPAPDGAGTYSQESIGRRTDGSLFPIEVSVNPMYLGGRKKFAVMVRDISAKRSLEAQKRVIDERKQKYYASAAHELRSPLGSLLGFANMLAKRQIPEETVREVANIMSVETTRLVKLINELLDFAKLETGSTADFDIQVQSLVPVIETTLQSMGGMEGIESVGFSQPDAIPDVAIDARKMQQALTNIISNAIKYSPDGGQIDVIVRLVENNAVRCVELIVKDRGIGMTPAQKDRIFEPFYRARQLPTAEGSGLGMAITHDLVKLQNGSIKVETELGQGTRIAIYLPAVLGQRSS
nr:ATP-binding protein [uncultured Noviherbaspirillum sp.]